MFLSDLMLPEVAENYYNSPLQAKPAMLETVHRIYHLEGNSHCMLHKSSHFDSNCVPVYSNGQWPWYNWSHIIQEPSCNATLNQPSQDATISLTLELDHDSNSFTALLFQMKHSVSQLSQPLKVTSYTMKMHMTRSTQKLPSKSHSVFAETYHQFPHNQYSH